jgi:arginyl-tRNA synthetase
VYLELQQRLSARLSAVLLTLYQIEQANFAIEQPPELNFGEYALPVAFELARKLRKAPKVIATEIAAALVPLEGFASFEVAGAGYINARLDRATAAKLIASDVVKKPETKERVLVEHTSINPNKAAHIGHLRNAILGDTFVNLLRATGHSVAVQNYIDNTGVQVADVVVGFLQLEGKTVAEVETEIKTREGLSAGLTDKKEAFDYRCWDLYARVSQWYSEGTLEEQAAKKKIRLDTLHLIEAGGNTTAEIAELISTAVLRRHLETMFRLGIEYDFLPRESEILHLKFWESAFEKLKATGVLYHESEGKNKGCWVMRRPGTDLAEIEGTDEDAKVIVRSNGTVTYVGKDIAYHMWKFGLLGRDFGYKPFHKYPDPAPNGASPGHVCWISCEHGVAEHPHFGGVEAIYNVIDARQSDPQSNVIQALRGMGHEAEADRYTHFSYEMVALTPRYAEELGYTVSDEDKKKSYIEVSGRKGFGVKADDLMNLMIAASRGEILKRHTDWSEAEVQKTAEQIAYGALRYFMLRYTRNSVIAFDQKDALAIEGETGPYVQYALVRAKNIFRKAGVTPEAVLAEFAKTADSAKILTSEADEDIWTLLVRASKRSFVLEQCLSSSEPAFLAKHAFQLAQEFNNFYHKHHILTAEDQTKRKLLLAIAAIALRELIATLALLGIDAPEAM